MVVQDGEIRVDERVHRGTGGSQGETGLLHVGLDDSAGAGLERAEQERALTKMLLHLVESGDPRQGEFYGEARKKPVPAT